MRTYYIAALALSIVLFNACSLSGQQKETREVKLDKKQHIAAFAEGCFWCSEHIFEELAGVDSAVSGYAGGHTINPTYEEVCSERTGHAETILVYYNPEIISYSQLLDAFFNSHDPTTKDRQGPDVGSSYRSAIFYLNAEQEKLALQAVVKWKGAFKDPIVTQIAPLDKFYRAEEYHQNYANDNPYNPYIRNVSMPRFNAFKQECKLKMKSNN